MTTSNANPGSMSSEINVTPLIDVLLVLLIIFMVIVPVMSKGEAALAPRPALHSDAGTQDAVVLEVLMGTGEQALYRINQQDVARQDLAVRLAAIYANRANRVLFVKGDDSVSFTQVAEAIDIGHAAGVDRIGLITPKVEAGL